MNEHHPAHVSISDGFLYTDLYELTMAQLYYRTGMHEMTARFEHFFRSYPDYGAHRAGYCINAGLAPFIDWVESTHIRDEEIEHLRSMKSAAGDPLFAGDFLAWLSKNGHFRALHIEAVPEGRVVHAHAPMHVVRGPLAVAQILESALLNQINYPTLVATKSSRIQQNGRGGSVVDFGLRRAQGRAAHTAARAALIGGADFSSHTGVSFELGYPPRGTHAHSMVQAFMALGADEQTAFEQYADVYPDNCILLVDTVDTLHSGIPNAIRVFEQLKKKGHRPLGVRLDSGDLAYLAVQAAKMLNEAGFDDCRIVLSNQLDELVIHQIIAQIETEARRENLDADAVIGRLAYGVGTRLVTSWGCPALDGVYKLTGMRKNGAWRPAIKLSENPEKVPPPGEKHVWRIYDERERATADYLCLTDENPREADTLILRHPVETSEYRALPADGISGMESLLISVWSEGERTAEFPDIDILRRRREEDLERLDPGVKRLINPHRYHVSVSEKLREMKQRLIEQARRNRPAS